MGVVRKQAGAQSVSFFVTADPDAEGFITQFNIGYSTWEDLPTGKLKDLLTASYLKPVTPPTVPATFEVDPEAFVEALATSGAFQVTSTYNDEEVEDSYWDLVATDPVLPTDPPKGSPILVVTANAYDVDKFATSVRVSCSYSASE